MRHEIDVPVLPTVKEWLETTQSEYFEVLDKEAHKRWDTFNEKTETMNGTQQINRTNDLVG